MKVPEGYVVQRVLSAGPVASVGLARRRDGEVCVVKTAAMDRALVLSLLSNEEAVLRALGLAGVAGVPRLLEAWVGGFALEWLAMPTLREEGASFRESSAFRELAARCAFERLADVHAARDARGTPLEVVHGDVSPDNVYLSRDRSLAALADFGLSRWRGGGSPEGPEGTGAFRGTLLYAAPEVARGERFDGRADDFALAATLLHLATGIPLRDGSEPVMLVCAGTRPLDASHPWRSLAQSFFDRETARALLACLAFDPRDHPRETPRPC